MANIPDTDSSFNPPDTSAPITDYDTFIAWERLSRDSIDFKKVYVDMAGDLAAGLMLSQIIFWHTPDKHGNTKLRVVREGHYWLAKSRDDWWDEARLLPREVDRCLARLREAGLIETRVFKFAPRANERATPMLHIRILARAFVDALNAASATTRPNPKTGHSRTPNTNAEDDDSFHLDITA